MKEINKQKGVLMTNQTILATVEKSGNRFNAYDQNGNKITHLISTDVRKMAFENGEKIEQRVNKHGKTYWKRVPAETIAVGGTIVSDNEMVEVPTDHEEVLNFIHNSYSLKPKGLMMKELKWKYLVRSAVRGKNIMMTGPAGCGKTMSAKALVNSLSRPDYYFNLGATQDPRSTLIGNTHYDGKTYFSESLFVKAIQTPNAVILLDELSRAHPDAWNILMTVLDYGQRYLRIDEQDESPTIKVAEGVTFVATANIGNEYTSTRVMDKALMDRFMIVEMDTLTDVEELELLTYMFPNVKTDDLKAISEISHLTRTESKSDTARISVGLSTRSSVEMSGLLFDGFSLEEAAEVLVYPNYSDDGGLESERTFVKQLVQKYCSDGSDEELFSEQEIDEVTNS